MRPHCLRSRSDYFWTFALNLSLKFSTTKRRIYFQGGTPIIESLLISYHQLNTPPVIDWKIHRPEAKPCQSGRRSSLFVWFSLWESHRKGYILSFSLSHCFQSLGITGPYLRRSPTYVSAAAREILTALWQSCWKERGYFWRRENIHEHFWTTKKGHTKMSSLGT